MKKFKITNKYFLNFKKKSFHKKKRKEKKALKWSTLSSLSFSLKWPQW